MNSTHGSQGTDVRALSETDMQREWMDALHGWSSIQRQYRLSIGESLTRERDALWEGIQSDMREQLQKSVGAVKETNEALTGELAQKSKDFKQDVNTIIQQASEMRRMLDSEANHLQTSIENWKGAQKSAIEALNRHLQENRDLISRMEAAAGKVSALNNDDRPIPRFFITLAGAFLGCAGAIFLLLH